MLSTKPFLPRWVQAAGIVLIFAGIILPELIGFLRDDYHSSANYISELGAVGADYATVINIIAFPLVGLSVLTIIAFLWRGVAGRHLARIGLIAIAIGIPIGYMTAAVFPCDYGCPAQGSTRQAVHNLAGLIEYTIGAIGFVLLSLGLKDRVYLRTRIAVMAVGIIMAVSFVMMLLPEQAAFRGAWQRLADYGAFLLLIALLFRLRVKT